MRLGSHPEYRTYLEQRDADKRYGDAVAAWRESGEPIPVDAYSLRWTYTGVQAFVDSLAHLFQEFNRVLWERFPYCRQCRGGCCVLGAVEIHPLDSIALAIRGRSLPTLPDDLEALSEECIYHTAAGCAWPAEWRPIKCWSFYCLGGRWELLASMSEQHRALTRALRRVVLDLLPDALRRYEYVQDDPLVAHLDDPVDLAAAFGDALYEVLVVAFNDRYLEASSGAGCRRWTDGGGGGGAASAIASDALAFVAEAGQRVCESPPPVPEGMTVSVDQLLADLELLEWIVTGRPADGAELLADLSLRYVDAPAPEGGELPTAWYRMRGQVLCLCRDWEQLRSMGRET